jgi:hypothetical protein
VEIFDDLLCELSTELCLQLLKHEKRKQYLKTQQQALPQLHTTTTDRRNRTEVFKHIEARPYKGDGADGAENGHTYEDSHFCCDHCGAKVTSGRYAPHLERCMMQQRGGSSKPQTTIVNRGRRSTRSVKRMYDDFLDADFMDDNGEEKFDDDDEFEEAPKPKKKAPPKKKKKKETNEEPPAKPSYEEDLLKQEQPGASSDEIRTPVQPPEEATELDTLFPQDGADAGSFENLFMGEKINGNAPSNFWDM